MCTETNRNKKNNFSFYIYFYLNFIYTDFYSDFYTIIYTNIYTDFYTDDYLDFIKTFIQTFIQTFISSVKKYLTFLQDILNCQTVGKCTSTFIIHCKWSVILMIIKISNSEVY